MLILKRFPMPPTSNRLLMPSRGRLIKSTEYRAYEQKVVSFHMRNVMNLAEIEHAFKGNKYLRIDTLFVFAQKRLISKKNEVKSLDASNRIKIVHDVISKLIHIDDKYFTCGYFEKAFCENESEEQVIIKFSEVIDIFNYKVLDWDTVGNKATNNKHQA